MTQLPAVAQYQFPVPFYGVISDAPLVLWKWFRNSFRGRCVAQVGRFSSGCFVRPFPVVNVFEFLELLVELSDGFGPWLGLASVLEGAVEPFNLISERERCPAAWVEECLESQHRIRRR